jgi:hypothetical protein
MESPVRELLEFACAFIAAGSYCAAWVRNKVQESSGVVPLPPRPMDWRGTLCAGDSGRSLRGLTQSRVRDRLPRPEGGEVLPGMKSS